MSREIGRVSRSQRKTPGRLLTCSSRGHAGTDWTLTVNQAVQIVTRRQRDGTAQAGPAQTGYQARPRPRQPGSSQPGQSQPGQRQPRPRQPRPRQPSQRQQGGTATGSPAASSTSSRNGALSWPRRRCRPWPSRATRGPACVTSRRTPVFHGVLHDYFSDKTELSPLRAQYKAECVTRYDNIVATATSAGELKRGFGVAMAATLVEEATLTGSGTPAEPEAVRRLLPPRRHRDRPEPRAHDLADRQQVLRPCGTRWPCLPGLPTPSSTGGSSRH